MAAALPPQLLDLHSLVDDITKNYGRAWNCRRNVAHAPHLQSKAKASRSLPHAVVTCQLTAEAAPYDMNICPSKTCHRTELFSISIWKSVRNLLLVNTHFRQRKRFPTPRKSVSHPHESTSKSFAVHVRPLEPHLVLTLSSMTKGFQCHILCQNIFSLSLSLSLSDILLDLPTDTSTHCSRNCETQTMKTHGHQSDGAQLPASIGAP